MIAGSIEIPTTMKLAIRENRKTFTGTVNDARKRHSYFMFFTIFTFRREEVPLVRVRNVTKYEFCNINTFFFFVTRFCTFFSSNLSIFLVLSRRMKTHARQAENQHQ